MAASIGRIVSKNSSSIKECVLLVKHQACPLYNVTPVMYMKGKHYDPWHRVKRREKTQYLDREKLKNDDKKLMFLEKRRKQKEDDPHAEPDRTFNPRKPSMLETGTIFDPYVPPEGDGKHSVLRKQGMKDSAQEAMKRVQTRVKHVRLIRKYGESGFHAKDIAPVLQDIYIDAHNMLTHYNKRNENRLRETCTAAAMNSMTCNLERLTMRWEFIESIEPPKVVNVACHEMYIKDIYFAQVTLRMHTKQKLAIYDQFGRLMFGSPDLEKNVLEFVVFEKNIVDLYGKWRVTGKITPDWFPTQYKNQSYRLPTQSEIEDAESDVEDEAKDKKVKQKKRKKWAKREQNGTST